MGIGRAQQASPNDRSRRRADSVPSRYEFLVLKRQVLAADVVEAGKPGVNVLRYGNL